ncbi:MAG: hypothetical protein J5940_00660, partial [Clostridia bacterium]|nr:hypothetical protein [Clostridia bacterium]
MVYEGKANLIPYALEYRRGGKNHPDCFWLAPGMHTLMEYVRDSMTWKYVHAPDLPEKDGVALAYLWDEPRDIKVVRVSGKGIGADEVSVCCKFSHSWFEDSRRWKFDDMPYYFELKRVEIGEENILTFLCPVDWICKLYIIYNGKAKLTVSAYGSAVPAGKKNVTVINRSGGEISAFNGKLISCKKTEKDGYHGFSVTVDAMSGAADSETLLTVSAGDNSCSAYVKDVLSGAVFVPAAETVFIATDTAESDLAKTYAKYAKKSGKTVRERLSALPECELPESVKINISDKPQRVFSVPPFEPEASVDVPDEYINGQWRLSLWHILRHSLYMENGTLCVSIWPFDKGEARFRDGNEGAACIAAESWQIIKTLDLLGAHYKARDAINYWLDGESATPFIRFAEVMGKDTLSYPYNSFNRCSPGYDQKHTCGHGRLLNLIAFHYRMTGDDKWFDGHIKRITGACLAVKRLRDEMKKHLTPESRVWGFLPPMTSGDFGETRIHYVTNAVYAGGLRKVGEILKEKGVPEADIILAEADDFDECLMRSIKKSIAECPVKKVGDGSYRRYLTWQVPSRGTNSGNVPWAPDPRYMESESGGINLRGYTGGTVADETLDMLEDTLFLHAGEDTSKSPHGNHVAPRESSAYRVAGLEPDEEDIVYRGGYGCQCGYETNKKAYLERGERKMYLRALFNSYTIEVAPERGWIFWEGPNEAGAADKTFEEAAIIEAVRDMLVFEDGDTIHLCRAIPEAWLNDGKHIEVKNIPVVGGKI